MNAPENNRQLQLVACFNRLHKFLLEPQIAAEEAQWSLQDYPDSVQYLANTLGLSLFECDILLCCAGMQLDQDMPAACAGPEGKSPAYPCFGRALSSFANPHWSALTADAPLRAWHLIEVADCHELLATPLKLDERILHHLIGLAPMDQRLSPYVTPIAVHHYLPESMTAQAGAMTRALSQSFPPLILLDAEDGHDAVMLAGMACEPLGLNLWRLDVRNLPTNRTERDTFTTLWQRESLLQKRALFIDAQDLHTGQHFLEELGVACQWVFIHSAQHVNVGEREIVRIKTTKPPQQEQLAMWRQLLGNEARRVNGELREISSQFSLGVSHLRHAAAQARQSLCDGVAPMPALWNACRDVSAPQLSELAQEIEPLATWDDLIIPDKEKQVLHMASAHVRQRHTVYQQWGFAEKSHRGLGISMLFHGDSGTGKTMAAEVLANELDLPLYRIDLSTVVNKYIGETEKNLRAVFDAAEAGGAILLFDEADALFGKRSEVHDSHDRYANIEVSYLLQRMESYCGLAIMTTNMKSALDPAFLRRIRFIVEFPFPAQAQRQAIWQRVFPKHAATQDLDYQRLSKLNVAGGTIRNIALNAAFLAADEQSKVAMSHVYTAAQIEYTKLEKPLTDMEAGKHS
ncbi:MAG: ATP-binding protein [Gammaproteobacteria bacterium]|nr:ATP-binding protein [Gammaproteobacteria bacterium]